MTTDDDASRLTRRTLLGSLAAGAGVGWLASLTGCINGARRARTIPTEVRGAAPTPRVLTRAEWKTLDAALDVMLPSGSDSPGSRDVHGIGYLDAALADPDTDPADVRLVKSGAAWLDEAARLGGAIAFADASPAARDVALRIVSARDQGPAWVLLVLTFGLEALLGDPIHGGNPGEVGWLWLGHRPGEPRPSAKAVEGPR